MIFRRVHHPPLAFCLCVIFSENRCPLFGITHWRGAASRAALSGLPGRTGHGAVGTKHAAVTGQGLERLAAARAYKKETAGIGRHPLGRGVPAAGAFEYGYGLHPSDRGIAERHLPAPSLALSRRAARSIAACGRFAQSLHPRRH